MYKGIATVFFDRLAKLERFILDNKFIFFINLDIVLTL